MQHICDMASDSDDEVLRRFAWKGALADAQEQIAKLDDDARAKLRYELIDQHASMAMKDGCSRGAAIRFAMKRFGVKERTVETALKYMKQKREAEAAQAPKLFTMTPEAEAKAAAFKAKEAEIKAQAKQRFERFNRKLMLWLKFR